MEKKLDAVSDRRDKRQGSLIFDALGPNAAETAKFYADLHMLESRTYGDTATGEDLTRRCMERGVFRKGATKATFYGVFQKKDGSPFAVTLGARFHLENLNYVVLKEGDVPGRYIMECETPGTEGNFYLGNLIPVDYLEGLAEAKLTELLTDGEDEEKDEELRKRYLSSFNTDAFGGNVADYKAKVSGMQGVGGVKVYPVWNGGGTVKLVILDSGYKKPTNVETDALQEAIDPRSTGKGKGIAPVGHCVTVEGVSEVVCNITMKISVKEGVMSEEILQQIKTSFESYFLELRKQWADCEYLVVRVSYLEARALNGTGVLDVQYTKINGLGQNCILQENEIPTLGKFEVI